MSELVRPKERLYIKEPKYAQFPRSEYEARIKKAKKLSEERGIDLLLLFMDDNTKYFTGFNQYHQRSEGQTQAATTLIPQEGDPVMVITEFFRGVAEGCCFIEDVRGAAEDATVHATEVYPKLVGKTIKDMGFDKKTIGIEIGYAMNMQNISLEKFESLKAEIPDAKFVSAVDVIWGCRIIKSKLEVKRMERASEIVAKAYEKVEQNVKIGMDEDDVGRIIKTTFMEEGAEWIGHVMVVSNPERYMMLDTFPIKGVKLREGNVLCMDIGCEVDGYHSDQSRVFYLGTPPKRFKEAYDTVLEAQKAGFNAIKPGVRACDIWKAVADVVLKAGWKPLHTSGHGLGLELHELPRFNKGNTMVLEPGMVFTIEPWIFDCPRYFQYRYNLGPISVEDLYLVTQKGSRELTTAKKELVTITR